MTPTEAITWLSVMFFGIVLISVIVLIIYAGISTFREEVKENGKEKNSSKTRRKTNDNE